MYPKPIFITGIGTGVGKTVTSAILVETLKADYWKPIQSGDLHHTDTERVRSLVTNCHSKFHEESYRLTQPFSPHKSAALDGVVIDMDKIRVPLTANRLVIEGAGGLMVPLNENDLMIDLIRQLDAEVVLVSQNYLGSINHTLLSVELLKAREILLRNIIFCGETNTSSENIIGKHSNVPLLHIPFFAEINPEQISEFANGFNLLDK